VGGHKIDFCNTHKKYIIMNTLYPIMSIFTPIMYRNVEHMYDDYSESSSTSLDTSNKSESDIQSEDVYDDDGTEKLDSVVSSVICKFHHRASFGKEKYGTDLDREDLTFLQWVHHAQEEHMDAILYLEKIAQMEKKRLSEKSSESDTWKVVAFCLFTYMSVLFMNWMFMPHHLVCLNQAIRM